ncbi:hypothetical protein WMY93_032821 [Mugilogobius chulae]|uniref:Transmembrane protein 200C n=1 Tax=Mugilogobius chulae TaxID=88201 RepID=A0AAW0MJS2_9GOBI
MIATGGLLRINARRQDSLRNKPRVPKPKKPRKKRTQEVVVVQGRLQLCSLSGLVALVGLVVLLVGGVLAAVGYCPQDLLFKSGTSGRRQHHLSSGQIHLLTIELQERLNSSHNSSLNVIQTLLQRFLDSDRLKVLGPLVMGVGIFLFLCANAVLHENRDKKTKVIKLQDIYSTVIDLHQSRDRSRDRTSWTGPGTWTGPGLGQGPVQSPRPAPEKGDEEVGDEKRGQEEVGGKRRGQEEVGDERRGDEEAGDERRGDEEVGDEGERGEEEARKLKQNGGRGEDAA